jgi:hypothetical protein
MTTLLLRQTATISRNTRVADGQGGWYEVFTAIAEAVPCKLDGPSPGGDDGPPVALGQRERAVTKRTLFMLAGVNIRRDDVVAVSTGEEVTVVAVRRPGGVPFVLEEHYEIDVEELSHGR